MKEDSGSMNENENLCATGPDPAWLAEEHRKREEREKALSVVVKELHAKFGGDMMILVTQFGREFTVTSHDEDDYRSKHEALVWQTKQLAGIVYEMTNVVAIRS